MTGKIIHIAVLALLAASSIGQAMAYDVPGYSRDSRVREVTYDPNQVVRLYLQRGFSTHVVLGADEQILVAAPGDSANWIVIARKGDHDIYIKPKASAMPSNLNVQTNRRSYAFDLLLGSNKMFLVRFRYDGANDTDGQGQSLVSGRLAQKALPRNFRYSMQVMRHSDMIAPKRMYDDGRFTYITIPGNREMPAVFRVADDKTESLTNSHMECSNLARQCSDTIVVHEVAKRFVLRLGNEVVGLWNDAYDPDGVPPEDGMVAGNGSLRRVVRGAE